MRATQTVSCDAPLGGSEPWPLAANAWAIGAQYKAAEVREHNLCSPRTSSTRGPWLSGKW